MVRPIKCLIWDLDNTLWDGTLMEGDPCIIKPGLKSVLKRLDGRGILHSIASKNDPAPALRLLKKKGVDRLFLHPQIGWISKPASIQNIANKLNIDLDSVGFIDDEPYELEQVRKLLPQVRVYNSRECLDLPRRPELNPPFMTDESTRRRQMYQQEARKSQIRRSSGMSQKEFLKFCRMKMTIRIARNDDMDRIMELMHRAHQMNATGIIYSSRQVSSFISDPRYRLYVVELRDRFVDYGKVGLAICNLNDRKWQLKSFLLSCRVLSRGIAFIFILWLQNQAFKSGAAEIEGIYKKRPRNRRMLMLYRLSGFKPSEGNGNGTQIFRARCKKKFKVPEWLTLKEAGHL
ncbi:MAG: hypothetical protein A2W25_07200 [candidate division Zixibacteria bacterium RBG_16_53_22]|nr:MAG: hypothetical protein A2W25_07200 [candidate division Zixibacteria bacterium RBG_16_53_22]